MSGRRMATGPGPRDADGASINLGVVSADRGTVRLEHKFYLLESVLGFGHCSWAVRRVPFPVHCGPAIDRCARVLPMRPRQIEPSGPCGSAEIRSVVVTRTGNASPPTRVFCRSAA